MKTDGCVDVREVARGKWRVKRNPEAQKYSRDAWDFRIVGKRGHICPWGGNDLACCIDGFPVVCHALSREKWVKSAQHGEDGINAVFDVNDIDKAVEYIKAYRKRVMTDERKVAAAERLAIVRSRLK